MMFFIIFNRVSEATLIGAEGITAEGSYTWGNEVALRLRPRL
jgi:hypothetical protein